MTLAQHHEGLGPGRAQSSSGASADGSVGQHGRLLGERDVRVGPTPGPRARGAGKPIHAAAPMHVLPQPCPTQNSHPKRAWLGIQDGARILSSTPPPPRQFKHKITSQPTKKKQSDGRSRHKAPRKKISPGTNSLLGAVCSEMMPITPNTQSRRSAIGNCHNATGEKCVPRNRTLFMMCAPV